MKRQVLSIVVGLAVIAASCADDTADEQSAESTVGTTSAQSAPSTLAAGGDSVSDEGDSGVNNTADEPVVESTPPDTEPVELTASYRGVSEDSITLGVAHIDWALIAEQFGFDRDFVPADTVYEAWTAALNDSGGIDGRQVEVVIKPFLPVGTGPSEQICLELMEDEEVFAVMGQMLDNNPLCFTEEYGHPYVGHFGETPEVLDRSDGLFFATRMAEIPQRTEAAQLLAEDGRFEGRRIALMWTDSFEAIYGEAVRPVLEAGGAEVVSEIETGVLTGNSTVDGPALSSALERAAADGADMIVSVGDYSLAHSLETNQTDLEAVLISEELSTNELLFQAPIGEEARARVSGAGMWRPEPDDLLADPLVQECIDEVEQYSDLVVDAANYGEVNDLVTHCQVFRLMVAILDAAGPDLTPERFIGAGEALGEIALPGEPDGLIGPDHRSAGRTVARYEYDSAAGVYVQVGDARVVE